MSHQYNAKKQHLSFPFLHMQQDLIEELHRNVDNQNYFINLQSTSFSDVGMEDFIEEDALRMIILVSKYIIHSKLNDVDQARIKVMLIKVWKQTGVLFFSNLLSFFVSPSNNHSSPSNTKDNIKDTKVDNIPPSFLHIINVIHAILQLQNEIQFDCSFSLLLPLITNLLVNYFPNIQYVDDNKALHTRALSLMLDSTPIPTLNTNIQNNITIAQVISLHQLFNIANFSFLNNNISVGQNNDATFSSFNIRDFGDIRDVGNIEDIEDITPMKSNAMNTNVGFSSSYNRIILPIICQNHSIPSSITTAENMTKNIPANEDENKHDKDINIDIKLFYHFITPYQCINILLHTALLTARNIYSNIKSQIKAIDILTADFEKLHPNQATFSRIHTSFFNANSITSINNTGVVETQYQNQHLIDNKAINIRIFHCWYMYTFKSKAVLQHPLFNSLPIVINPRTKGMKEATKLTTQTSKHTDQLKNQQINMSTKTVQELLTLPIYQLLMNSISSISSLIMTKTRCVFNQNRDIEDVTISKTCKDSSSIETIIASAKVYSALLKDIIYITLLDHEQVQNIHIEYISPENCISPLSKLNDVEDGVCKVRNTSHTNDTFIDNPSADTLNSFLQDVLSISTETNKSQQNRGTSLSHSSNYESSPLSLTRIEAIFERIQDSAYLLHTNVRSFAETQRQYPESSECLRDDYINLSLSQITTTITGEVCRIIDRYIRGVHSELLEWITIENTNLHSQIVVLNSVSDDFGDSALSKDVSEENKPSLPPTIPTDLQKILCTALSPCNPTLSALSSSNTYINTTVSLFLTHGVYPEVSRLLFATKHSSKNGKSRFDDNDDNEEEGDDNDNDDDDNISRHIENIISIVRNTENIHQFQQNMTLSKKYIQNLEKDILAYLEKNFTVPSKRVAKNRLHRKVDTKQTCRYIVSHCIYISSLCHEIQQHSGYLYMPFLLQNCNPPLDTNEVNTAYESGYSALRSALMHSPPTPTHLIDDDNIGIAQTSSRSISSLQSCIPSSLALYLRDILITLASSFSTTIATTTATTTTNTMTDSTTTSTSPSNSTGNIGVVFENITLCVLLYGQIWITMPTVYLRTLITYMETMSVFQMKKKIHSQKMSNNDNSDSNDCDRESESDSDNSFSSHLLPLPSPTSLSSYYRIIRGFILKYSIEAQIEIDSGITDLITYHRMIIDPMSSAFTHSKQGLQQVRAKIAKEQEKTDREKDTPEFFKQKYHQDRNNDNQAETETGTETEMEVDYLLQARQYQQQFHYDTLEDDSSSMNINIHDQSYPQEGSTQRGSDNDRDSDRDNETLDQNHDRITTNSQLLDYSSVSTTSVPVTPILNRLFEITEYFKDDISTSYASSRKVSTITQMETETETGQITKPIIQSSSFKSFVLYNEMLRNYHEKLHTLKTASYCVHSFVRLAVYDSLDTEKFDIWSEENQTISNMSEKQSQISCTIHQKTLTTSPNSTSSIISLSLNELYTYYTQILGKDLIKLSNITSNILQSIAFFTQHILQQDNEKTDDTQEDIDELSKSHQIDLQIYVSTLLRYYQRTITHWEDILGDLFPTLASEARKILTSMDENIHTNSKLVQKVQKAQKVQKLGNKELVRELQKSRYYMYNQFSRYLQYRQEFQEGSDELTEQDDEIIE